MYHGAGSLLLLLTATSALGFAVDSEIYKNIPGLTKDSKGHLLFNGEEVVSISGADGEEIVHMDSVEALAPVRSLSPVVSLSEVDQLKEVIAKHPVLGKKPIKSIKGVSNIQEVSDMQEVKAEEIAKMAEVLNMEEVVDMQEVSVEEVPEDVAERFLNMLEEEKAAEMERSSRLLGPVDLDDLVVVDEEPSADELGAQVEEITSMLELKRKELVVKQEELRSLLRVIKKLELQYVEELSSMEEVTKMQELKNIQEIKRIQELASVAEVVNMQEVDAQEVEATELKSVKEIVNMKELTPAQAAKLREMIAESSY